MVLIRPEVSEPLELVEERYQMFHPTTIAALLVMALSTALVSPVYGAGADPFVDEPPPAVPVVVTVTLASGRIFTAAVDARTDAKVLWLRFDGPASTLLRPVQWERVTGAFYEGRPRSREELQHLVPQLLSRRELPTRPDSDDGPAAAADRTSGSSQAPEPRANVGPVCSIRADAYVARWDANTESDGILLFVSPVDEAGHLVPVAGTLDVELIGDRRSALKPQPVNLREQFSTLASWTVSARRDQFANGRPAEYRLPFQAIHPDFDPAVDDYGLLIVRLAVPGRGVFQTSVSDLRIRPLDSFRDRIETSTGSRFLPNEQTGQ